jgi:hypothetical protein
MNNQMNSIEKQNFNNHKRERIMKLELTNDTKIAIWKIGNAALMCQDKDITSAKYEEISLEAMNEANDAQSKKSVLTIPCVTASTFSNNEDELINFLDDLNSERDNYSRAKLIELIKEKLINESEVSVCECRPEWMLEIRPNLVKCSKCNQEY